MSYPYTNKRGSALSFVLHGLIPYTQENIMLTFKPNKFFHELEKISKYKQPTLKKAWIRAKDRGYIVQTDQVVQITKEGLRKIQPLIAKKLQKDVNLMITFDIPEAKAHLRRRLRTVLRDWHFTQVQKSVWVSNYDYKESLAELIKELKLDPFVQLFETFRFFP